MFVTVATMFKLIVNSILPINEQIRFIEIDYPKCPIIVVSMFFFTIADHYYESVDLQFIEIFVNFYLPIIFSLAMIGYVSWKGDLRNYRFFLCESSRPRISMHLWKI